MGEDYFPGTHLKYFPQDKPDKIRSSVYSCKYVKYFLKYILMKRNTNYSPEFTSVSISLCISAVNFERE